MSASLLGWGAHFITLTTQGRWLSQETGLHIHLLEPRAVRNVCLQDLPCIKGKSIRIIMENVWPICSISTNGRSKIPLPVCWSYKIMDLVYSPSDSDLSLLLSRSPECHSQYAQQVLLPGLQMGIGLSDLSWDIPEVGTSTGTYSLHPATGSAPYSAQEEA